MDHFAGLDVSVKETSVCIVDDTGKIVREVKVASEPEDLLEILNNPTLQTDWAGSRAIIAVAVQCTGRSGLAGDLCRDAAYEGGVEGGTQPDLAQRCPWHGADDAGGTLPPGACEDATQSETANADRKSTRLNSSHLGISYAVF